MRRRVPSRVAIRVAIRAAALGGVLLAAPVRVAGAQLSPEARVDVLAARRTAVEAGVGVAVPAGTNLRLALLGAAGTALGSGGARPAARAELLARFQPDPFHEYRWTPYAAGGLALPWTRGARLRPALVVLAGVALPDLGPLAPAIEGGVGGGVRLGVALHRATPGRR